MSKDFWKKAKVKVKKEQKKEEVPRKLKGLVYRTGKTWKLKATAFVGEPGKIEVLDKALKNVLNIDTDVKKTPDNTQVRNLL